MSVKITQRTIFNMMYPKDAVTPCLLDEIMYWSKYTNVTSTRGHPIILFTYLEWADRLGMTKRQVENSFKKLKNDDIITTYTKKTHLRSDLIRVLHVELSTLFMDIIDLILEGDLTLNNNLDNQIVKHTGCAQEAHLGVPTKTHPDVLYTIYKPDNNQYNGVDYTQDSQKGFIMKIDDVIKNLEEKKNVGRIKISKQASTSNEPIEVWRNFVSTNYPDYFQTNFTMADKAKFKRLLKEFNSDRLTEMFKEVIGKWDDFLETLSEETGKHYSATYPNFRLVYAHRNVAINFSKGNFKKSVHSSAKTELKTTVGANKLKALGDES